MLADIRAANVKNGLASVSLNAPGILQALGSGSGRLISVPMRPVLPAPNRTRKSSLLPVRVLTSSGEPSGLRMPPLGVEAINAAGMLSVGIGAGLNHAGLQLHSTRELTRKCPDFWASRTVQIRN